MDADELLKLQLALTTQKKVMKTATARLLKDGDQCKVIAGTHVDKQGTVRDINTSKTVHITITVEQSNGVRFKTLGKNVTVVTGKVK